MNNNRNIGILILSTIQYPGYLGDAIRLPSLSRELAKAGFDVHLFITNVAVNSDKEICHNGFWLHYVKMPFNLAQKRLRMSLENRSTRYRVLMAFMQVLAVMKLTTRLGSFCKKHKIDVFISYMPHRLTIIPTSICKLLFRKPLIVDAADKYDCDPVERFFLKRSDQVAYITSSLRKELEAKYGIKPESLFYLPNGVDLHLFKRTKSYKNPYPRGKKIVLFVGDIYTIDILIKAAPLVIDKIPDTLFVVVGNGKAQSWKMKVDEAGLLNCFHFTGYIPHNEIPKYIHHADVCVSTFTHQPYLEYALPLKLFEYMACGKPIVATNVAGTAEVIKHGYNGFLIEPNEHENFAKYINLLLVDSHMRKKMGSNGKAFVRKFTWKLIAKTLVKRIKKLIRSD